MTANRAKTSASEARPARSRAGLPAKALSGRPVVVALGGEGEGIRILARALDLLGVDMLAPDAGEDDWRRPAVSQLNLRLLEAIGRPPGHPAHALPFPASWWRAPAVRALRPEMLETVRLAVEAEPGLWGFADEHTARLLPAWTEVFDTLGLSPVCVWSLSPPHALRAPRHGGRSMGEILWFAQAADVLRYGSQLCVVDERQWWDNPHRQAERLAGRLGLHWRGTRLDLYETLDALIDEAEPPAVGRRIALPLARALYDAVLEFDENPSAREKAENIAETAELLRPMIAPLLPGKAEEQPPADLAEIGRLREELESLRGAIDGFDGEPAAPAPSQPVDERIAALQMELDAQRAETQWLHEQYGQRLREAETELEGLRNSAGAEGGASESDLAAARAEIQRLQNEMNHLNNANERYLARIYELKKALEDRGGAGGIG